MTEMKEELAALAGEVREEVQLARKAMEKIWQKSLVDRVSTGRALGPLRMVKTEADRVVFAMPREDYSVFREDEAVRISRDTPSEDFVEGFFGGLSEDGLFVKTGRVDHLLFAEKEGWTIDQNLVDLSKFYLNAIGELGKTAHGRDGVYPVLFGEVKQGLDEAVYNETLDGMGDESGLNESQEDAVATCLAAAPFHLVQGPPGTGKTFTLARVVEQLVERGHRVLVTAFTHRAIHNALSKVKEVLGDRCPVVKVSQPVFDELAFPVYENFEESGLADHDGPYVIGATPFALWTGRLGGVEFDSVVLDETSQMTVPAALMVMLKTRNWFFFGDDKQLPPVSHVYRDDPSAASVFARLRRRCEPTTLDVTYRMNDSLTLWPSENFYGGRLRSAVAGHRLALKEGAGSFRAALAAESPLVRMEFDHLDCRSRSDDEADVAAGLIEELLSCGVAPAEIGVVVPFRAQAARIRSLLRGIRFSGHRGAVARELAVDTVDRFQGQEREVVIVSLVSSDRWFIERLEEFLLSPQRLNVAVTRARTKVVILHSAELRESVSARREVSESCGLLCSLFDAAVRVSENHD